MKENAGILWALSALWALDVPGVEGGRDAPFGSVGSRARHHADAVRHGTHRETQRAACMNSVTHYAHYIQVVQYTRYGYEYFKTSACAVVRHSGHVTLRVELDRLISRVVAGHVAFSAVGTHLLKIQSLIFLSAVS